MAAWDISPSGVQEIVGATGLFEAEFESQLLALDTDLGGGAEQAASDPIATALVGWMDAARPDLMFLPGRTRSCREAAVAATNAYVAGDLEMAANAQAAAAAAPDPRALLPGGLPPR